METKTRDDKAAAPRRAVGFLLAVFGLGLTATLAHEARPAVPRSAASAPAESLTIASVVAGGDHSCAITGRGAAYCWGAAMDRRATSSRAPVAFGPTIAWRLIALGATRGCGVDTAGRTYCWGSNAVGQNGTEPDSLEHPAPTPVEGLPPLTVLSASEQHTCGVGADGRVVCWGANRNGELGRGFRSPWERPAPVFSLIRFGSVAVYGHSSCALTVEKRPSCWGLNAHWAARPSWDADCLDSWTADSHSGIYECVAVPIEMARYTPARGWPGRAACAADANSWFSCWRAVLGRPRRGKAWLAPALPASPWPELIALTGGSRHWCGIAADGTAYCEGDGSDGRLESPDSMPNAGTRAVAGGLRFRALAAGAEHTCGLSIEGRVYCWGRNEAGQLGSGSASYSATPVEVVFPH